MFRQASIIGVGLIGGSLGLAIRQKRLAKKVVGFGRKRGNLQTARRRGAVDSVVNSFDQAVAGADLILLCAPVVTIEKQLLRLDALVSRKVLVMDVGSTKKNIIDRAARLKNPLINFIGAHPMAGTEHAGSLHAEKGLFQNKLCVLIPPKGSSPAALQRAKRFWKRIGARVVCMEAARHDHDAALVSHLPHMAAYALMSVLTKKVSPTRLKLLAGGGVRDTTRIAASPGSMWRDIVLSNRGEIIAALKNFRSEIDFLTGLVKNARADKLEKYFEKAARQRRHL